MPRAAFLTPGVLYISSGVASEFRFLKPAFGKAREAGYTRFVEPACGAFAMCHLAQQSGWEGAQMEGSDVILFSAVLGHAIMGKDLADLEIRIQGFEDQDLTDPATVIWAQATARARARSSRLYWAEVTRAMMLDRDRHIEQIQRQLDRNRDLMHGLTFHSEDLFDHLDRVAGDPKTVVSLNPPSTAGGYEKFFDTGGTVTWKEPTYSVFDPVAGYARLDDYMRSAKALLAIYEENVGGHQPRGAFIGRGAGKKGPSDTGIARSVNYYVVSNRPDEFAQYGGGLVTVAWSGFEMDRGSFRLLPQDHQITSTTEIQVVPISGGVANYYRGLWTHNFVGGSSLRSLALLLDGYLVGVFGYDPTYLFTGTPGGKVSDSVLLQFGMTVPQKRMRFNRLLGRIALCRQSLALILSDLDMVRAGTVSTAQLTQYPETKEYRGIMTLDSRKRDPQHGFRLVYKGPIADVSWASTLAIWMKDEERWQRARQKAKAPSTA